ncbi:MAG: GHKL domain-containing protein [Lachnospiraceae bacterium]|nr:GHKL domain-containing protein [Lachnospiraceae bacterium]
MLIYTIVYFGLYIIEGLFFWKYCTVVLKSLDKLYEIAVTEIFYIALFFITGTENFEKNIFYFAFINFLSIYILYHVAWYVALLHTAITSAIMAIGELFVICATAQMVPFQINEISSNSLMLNDILSRLLYLIFLYIILSFARNIPDRRQENYKVFVLMLIVPVISISIVPLFVFIVTHAMLKPTFGLIISLSTVFLTILNLIVLGACGYILKRNNEFASLQMQIQKDQELTEYYKIFLEQNENRNIFIHDMKKHLQSIQLLYKQGNPEKVITYVDKILQSLIPEDNLCVSDRTLLNAIMSRYGSECRRRNIMFYTDIRKNAVGFMAESDLTALFCNLLDNALEAASLQKDVNPFIELNVEYRNNGNYAVITMVNSCIESPCLSKTGQLLSTKKDRHRHGYGMRSIRKVISTYRGKIQMYYNQENNTFHTIIMLTDTDIARE